MSWKQGYIRTFHQEKVVGIGRRMYVHMYVDMICLYCTHTHTHIRTYTCTYVCIIIHMTVQMPLQNTCENVFAARLSGVAGLRWGGPHCYSAAGSSLSCTWCTGCQWGLAGLPWWATCIVWTDIIHRQANVHMYMYVCIYVCIILCVEVCM